MEAKAVLAGNNSNALIARKHEDYQCFENEKLKHFKVRVSKTVHTKKLHLWKTDTTNIHTGILLLPALTVGVSKLVAHGGKINWWESPFSLGFAPAGILSFLTYVLAIPLAILDSYQRHHRLQYLKLQLRSQTKVLQSLDKPKNYQDACLNIATKKYERAYYKRLNLDRTRHLLHLGFNTVKLTVGSSAVVIQSLAFAKVLISATFFSLVGGVTLGLPFIFALSTLGSNALDLYYASRKLHLAKYENKTAARAYVIARNLYKLRKSSSEDKSYVLSLYTQYKRRKKACINARERLNKRKKKIIYRVALVLVALCVCLPAFGVPPIIAAAAGIVSLVAMLTYAYYQRCQHIQKKLKANLKTEVVALDPIVPAAKATPSRAYA